MAGGAATAEGSPPPRKGTKQAVVLIHGMGEQIPMETLKGFVETVWTQDPGVARPGAGPPNGAWSKPDTRTGSLELRRFTTQDSRASGGFPRGVRTDFYELYWADLTAGSTWDQFTGWVQGLLFRTWKNTPKDVRLAWVGLWIASLFVLVLGLAGLVPGETWECWFPCVPQKVVVAAAAALLAVLHRFASKTFGRVVRYTRADPDNIAARAAVRERGLNLLRALHADDDYARVVVVGHSLGTILAYDLVSYFWAEQAAARTLTEGSPTFAALKAVDQASATLAASPSDANRAAFLAAQAGLHRAMAAQTPVAGQPGSRWLISDLVTLGSPLTHAEFLLSKGEADLEKRKDQRELPSSPPVRETLTKTVLAKAVRAGLVAPDASEPTLSVYPPGPPETWSLHHAAPFAAVRWTNVYDPAHWVIMGDQISGPLRGAFGQGIVDIDLSAGDKPSRGFTHTRYWDLKQSPKRLETVRKAVNLLDD